jgi:hypothetical protein
MSGASPSVF